MSLHAEELAKRDTADDEGASIRRCERLALVCEACHEGDVCSTCPLRPAITPGSPDLDEDRDDERASVDYPDHEMRVSR